MGNSATSKVIGKGTIKFRSHDECIITSVHHVPESRYNLISLGALHREKFSFSSKGDLMKVFKEAHVMFQVKRVGNMYMLQNLKVTVGGLQLSSVSKPTVVEQSETTMVSTLDVQLYPEEKLGLGA